MTRVCESDPIIPDESHPASISHSLCLLLCRLAKYKPFNTVEHRQQIAQKMIERGKYTLA